MAELGQDRTQVPSTDEPGSQPYAAGFDVADEVSDGSVPLLGDQACEQRQKIACLGVSGDPAVRGDESLVEGGANF